MQPKSLRGIIRKGLENFKKKIKTRKEGIQAKLAQSQAISAEDEHWLDNEANTVDEEQIIERLEAASDYEREVERLDSQEKEAMRKLREYAGDISAKVVGNKQKRSLYETEFHASQKKAPKAGALAIPVFTKKENATLSQRIEVLDWHYENGQNQTKTAKHFDKIYPNLKMKQPLVSKWLSKEEKLRSDWQQSNAQNGDRNAKRVRQTEHPEVTEMLELWISKAMDDNIIVTGEVLRTKWMQFADLVGIPKSERLTLSNGWLQSLKERMGLKESKRHGEAGSANAKSVEQERKRIQELITKYGYTLRDIFNMDETGHFWAMVPDRGLTNKKRSGVKGKKVRMTYAFTCNADGSEKLPPFIIGKAARPRAFQRKTGAQLGFYYRHNAKAWMTGSLYKEWIQNWDKELRMKGRKILLLQDNFSGHIVPDGLTNIRVENLAPNLTAHIQPMDQGIIRCFKAYYRAKFILRAIDRYEDDITPSDIYNINQLQAMRLADAAWREVDTTTIRNCWRKAEILPEIIDTHSSPPNVTVSIASLLLDTPDHVQQEEPADHIAQAELQVEEALDDLVATGALQKANRMGINSFLNPLGETEHLVETTDEEIYQAVIAAITARENSEASGGDDVDDVICIEPRPSRKEVKKAISTLTRFIDDYNNPVARKLESILSLFNRQLRLEEHNSLKDTTITKFFAKA